MDGCGEHDGLLAGGLITDLAGVGQPEKLLNAVFSDRVEPVAEFRPLGINCAADDFSGLGVIGAGIRRLRDLAGEGDEIRKVSVKTLIRQQFGNSVERPGEQPVLFLTADENPHGIALAWLPECEPYSGNAQSVAQTAEHGHVWFGLAVLVAPDLTLALTDALS